VYKLVLLKLQKDVRDGYEKTVNILNFLIKDSSIAEQGIGLHLIFIGSYLHIGISIPVEKLNLLAGVIKSNLPKSEIGDFNLVEGKVIVQEINLSKRHNYSINNQSFITSDILSTIVNVFLHSHDPFCGLSLWIKPNGKGIVDKLRANLKDKAYLKLSAEDKKKTLSKYVKARIALFGGKDMLSLASHLSTSLKQLGVKDENSYQLARKNLSTFGELVFQPKFNDSILYTIPELASIVHLPDSDKVDFSRIVLNLKTTVAPPKNIIDLDESDKTLSVFAKTTFNGIEHKIGVRETDRKRHLYVLGKSGMGKSKLIENLVISDFKNDRAVIFIDPHGEAAREILALVPENRVKDVVYFDPSHAEIHMGFNPLEITSTKNSQSLIDGFVSIFQKSMTTDWNDQLEHLLRMTLLALINTDNSTMPNIVKLLTDKDFRRTVIEKIDDSTVKNFWTNTFLTYQDRASNDINKLVNRISQLMTNKTVRYVICQKKSAFDLEDIILNKKILIVSLAIGKLGEWTTSFLGSILITKIWQTMIGLSETKKSKYLSLYIDEFQHFATESFVQIFSEARKYGLAVTIANQYVTQIPEKIRHAIMGNIGSFVSFRVGADDAHYIKKEFAPTFSENDLKNLSQREIILRVSVDGITSQPFSAESLNVIIPEFNFANPIMQQSTGLGRRSSDVEKEIAGEFVENVKEFSSFEPPV
jgi:mannitol/fructose-specific phosphotransferase system IIA component (Ntr-type)